MTEDLIQLPEVKDIQEMLSAAKEDVQTQVDQEPDLEPSSQLINQVINVLEEKLGKEKDLNRLNQKQKIDIAAHLSFLQSLLEDFFFFDEEYSEDGEEYEDEDEDESTERG